MKAMLCPSLGTGLVLTELPAAPLGPHQVRIAVHAAGVNFADGLAIDGKYQEKPPLPFAPGFEVAGIVTEIGADVAGLKLGQRVAAMPSFGGYADEVVIDADLAFPIPESMGFEAAAGFAIAYGTSHLALDWRAELKAGETLLVHGAAGGVGLTAVEIGKALGARVIACASSEEKRAVAAAHGADHTLDSGAPDLREQIKALAPNGIDVAYDPVGGAAFEVSLRTIGWEGRILVIGFAGGTVPQIPANIVLVKNCTVIGFHWGPYRQRSPALLRRAFAQMFDWVEAGQIRPHVSDVLTLEQANEAIEAIRARRPTGKIVLTMGR